MNDNAYGDIPAIHLEKCPFCLGKAVLVPGMSVVCRNCGATGPRARTVGHNADRWNTRPAHPDPNERGEVYFTVVRNGFPEDTK